MSGPGAITVLAMCDLTHAKSARRQMLTELVDGAAGLASPGAKPRVRAYPNELAITTLQAVREYAASPDCSPDFAAHLSASVVLCAQFGRQLAKEQRPVCLLVGTYQVTDRPADADDNRPIKFFDGQRNQTGELFRSAPTS